MICKKCGADIPAQSKFCPFCGEKAAQADAPAVCGGCGLQLSPTDKFCPVCGTKAGESSRSASVFAGMQDTAMPSVGMPPQAPSQQANESASRLIDSMGLQRTEEPSAGGGVDLSKGRPSDSMPSPSYSGRPSDNIANFAVQAPSPVMDLGVTSAAAVSAAPIKKSKAWIWFVAGGGVLVILVVLAILLLTNRGAVMNMFMGDSGYARMIEANGVERLSAAAENPAVISQVKTLGAAAAAEIASEAAVNEAIAGLDDAYGYGGYSSSTIMGHSLYSGYNAGQVIPEIYNAFMQTYGTNGVTVTAKADLSLTSTAKELLFGSGSTEELNKTLNLINSSTITIKARAAEDRFAADLVLSDNSGFYADARGIVYSDGTVAVMFPFGSDKCIKYTVEQGEYIAVDETPELVLDEKEISRLVNAIVERYLDCYENSDITVENGAKLSVNGAEASGKLITAVMSREMISSLVTDSLELIATDEYLITTIADYLNECGVSVTKERITQEIRGSFYADNFPDTDLTIKTVVDGNGNVLAKSYGVKQRSAAQDDSDEFCIAYIDSSDLFELEMTFDGERVLGADVRKSSHRDGKADIRFYDEGEYLFGITVDYTDMKSAKFAGEDILTGTYTISFSAPADFTENNTLISGSVDSALYSAKLTLSSAVEKNTLKESISIAVPQYGTAGISIDITCENADTPAMSSDVIDVSDFNYGYSSNDLTEKADLMISMVSGIRAAIDGQKSTGSPYVETLSGLCDEVIAALEDAKSPQASYEDVNVLIERIMDDIDELEGIRDTYSEIFDSDLDRELEKLRAELRDIMSEINWYDVKQTALDSFTAKTGKIEESIAEFKDKVVELYQDSFGLSFDYMTFEELEFLLQLIEIELGYYNDILSYDGIGADITDAYRSANYDYLQARSAYQTMTSELEHSNTFSVAALRKLRKTTETAYNSLLKLEKLVGISDSIEF